MTIKINEDLMTLEIDDIVVAPARRWTGDWWEGTHRPTFFERDQAITALTVTELLEGSYGSDDPQVMALQEELR